jgi:hypothetical protein
MFVFQATPFSFVGYFIEPGRVELIEGFITFERKKFQEKRR